MYSIQARFVDEWRVAGYANELTLRYVTFKVSQAGRQRVLRTGVKNVHAYVIGGLHPFADTEKWRQVTYSPRSYDSFVMVYNMAVYAIESLPSLTLVTENGKPALYAPKGQYEVNDNGFLVKTEEK
jgi:hypothetical protein